MKVSRGREQGKSNRPAQNFTGGVWQDALLDNARAGMRVYAVFFQPGSRSFWHQHEGGQVLYVTSGEGRVGTADGMETVRAGDIVHAPPGEQHWHGAGPESVLHHVAVSLGATRWGREVSAEEYGKS